jgi:hypothetical protein
VIERILKVRVTERHIKKASQAYSTHDGRPNSCKCPIAQAMRSSAKKGDKLKVEVTPLVIRYGHRKFQVTKRSHRFMNSFDDNHLTPRVKPTTFVFKEKTA